MSLKRTCYTITAAALVTTANAAAAPVVGDYLLKAGDPSLREWLLPAAPPAPADNAPTAERIALGKMLFFDPRLSGDGNMSCGSCHNPLFGWSDGLPTARGNKSKVLARATPTIVNSGYNSIQMWDGRKSSLEDQAMGPMEANVEMNTNLGELFEFLRGNEEYAKAFERAYPGKEIGAEVVAKAIASFERTVISNDSPFDRWVKGDAHAMSEQAVRGFRIFLDPDKGNCAACHSGPNFTDNGFHNIGLASFGAATPDVGRYAQKPLKLMRGAFKTPTLRDSALTAPYFHDGSAATLMDVIEHYVDGGVVRTQLSPSLKALDLNQHEKEDLLAFLHALTSPVEPFVLPTLPVVETSFAAIQAKGTRSLARH